MRSLFAQSTLLFAFCFLTFFPSARASAEINEEIARIYYYVVNNIVMVAKPGPGPNPVWWIAKVGPGGTGTFIETTLSVATSSPVGAGGGSVLKTYVAKAFGAALGLAAGAVFALDGMAGNAGAATTDGTGMPSQIPNVDGDFSGYFDACKINEQALKCCLSGNYQCTSDFMQWLENQAIICNGYDSTNFPLLIATPPYNAGNGGINF